MIRKGKFMKKNYETPVIDLVRFDFETLLTDYIHPSNPEDTGSAGNDGNDNGDMGAQVKFVQSSVLYTALPAFR